MKRNEKIELLNILNELVREGELVISDSKTEELLSGEDIRIVLIKGDVIHIYLSESISVRREKNDCCLNNNT
jgi:hypothetical protein